MARTTVPVRSHKRGGKSVKRHTRHCPGGGTCTIKSERKKGKSKRKRGQKRAVVTRGCSDKPNFAFGNPRQWASPRKGGGFYDVRTGGAISPEATKGWSRKDGLNAERYKMWRNCMKGKGPAPLPGTKF